MKNVFLFLALIIISISTNVLFAQSKGLKIKTIQSIDSPVEEVFTLLRSLERFPEWSPFIVSDPDQKNYTTGIDGTVGSTFHWEGVAEKSLGIQSLSELKKNEYIRFNCDIQKPQKSKGVFEYVLEEVDGKTIVTQNFTIPCNGFSKFMMKLFGVKKQIQETNILGMERLKAIAEKESSLAQIK